MDMYKSKRDCIEGEGGGEGGIALQKIANMLLQKEINLQWEREKEREIFYYNIEISLNDYNIMVLP